MSRQGGYVVSNNYADRSFNTSVNNANFSGRSANGNPSAGTNNTSAVRFDDDQSKKQRVTDIALMVWGVLDVVAMALMVWAVLVAALVGVHKPDGDTIEVGLFEQCHTTKTGFMTCEKTDAFSRIPYWFWASGVFICSLLFTFVGIIMIGYSAFQGGVYVRHARFCAAARNFLLFAAWVLIPVGFVGLGENCVAGATNQLHCGLKNTALLATNGSDAEGYFESFELPGNWHSASGTYGLFGAVLIHYLASGIAGWVILRKGTGLPTIAAAKDPMLQHTNRTMGVTGGSSNSRRNNPHFNDSFASVGTGTSFDGPVASLMRSTMAMNDSFDQTRQNDRNMMMAYPTTTLSNTQRI
jgi:hypothetical protein